MAFEVHSDTAGHPAAATAGLAGWGVFVLCGSWTSANGETGVVPFHVVEEFGYGHAVEPLVSAGLWTVVEDGYRMEFGPGSDWPLPLWRYGSDPGDGSLLAIVRDPEATR